MQMTLEDFILPFGGKLDAGNRWVKLAALMPWDMIEDVYARSFKNKRRDGRPATPSYTKNRSRIRDDRSGTHVPLLRLKIFFRRVACFTKELLTEGLTGSHFLRQTAGRRLHQRAYLLLTTIFRQP